MTDPQDYEFDKFCAEMTTAPEDEGVLVLPLVLSDLKERAAAGKEKYGKDYRVETRKNALQEAYEEAMDLLMYLRSHLEQVKSGQAYCASQLRELQALFDKMESDHPNAGDKSIWKSNNPCGVVEYLYKFYCDST